jgi:hypothetical protein
MFKNHNFRKLIVSIWELCLKVLLFIFIDTCALILVLNAALHHPSIISVLPDYVFRHYRYLRTKEPDLTPNLQIVIYKLKSRSLNFTCDNFLRQGPDPRKVKNLGPGLTRARSGTDSGPSGPRPGVFFTNIQHPVYTWTYRDHGLTTYNWLSREKNRYTIIFWC